MAGVRAFVLKGFIASLSEVICHVSTLIRSA